MKYCTNCGRQLSDAVKYCGACGEKQDELTNEADMPNEASKKDIYVAPVPEPKREKRTKKCPYCAEDVLEDATMCRYCQTDLITGTSRIQNTNTKNASIMVNWRGLMCISFLLIQCIFIVLMFTELLTVKLDMGYGGLNAPDYSLGINVFTCFDISDFIESLTVYAPNIDQDDVSTIFFLIGVFHLALTLICCFLLLMRIYKVCSGNAIDKLNNFSGYNSVLQAILVVFVIILCLSANDNLEKNDLDFVNMGLSPTLIIAIVLLCIQLFINVLVNRNRKNEDKGESEAHIDEEDEDNWICKKCNKENDGNRIECSSCGLPRRYSMGEPWLCVKCFNANDPLAVCCVFCFTPRPSLYHADNDMQEIK